MAKLNQLLTLEDMLEQYDEMNIEDVRDVNLRGRVVSDMVDDVIARLTKHLESKTRLTCNNVLMANFDTMTQRGHWLEHKLFQDLPKAVNRLLRRKIEQMLSLMKALWMKIVDVEAEFADRFFERLKKNSIKYSYTDYDLWKKRHSNLTMNELTEYQAGLTAKMLILGVLTYDDAPSGEEMEGVDIDKLRKKLRNHADLPENFEEECAKLRRYSHWEGDMFVIDYQLLRDYLYRVISRMTPDQRIALYEYDVQMKQIHEDMQKQMVAQKSKEGMMGVLGTPKAMKYWARLMDLGLVDENCQLMPDTSRQQAMYIAEPFAEKLRLKNKWKLFEDFWGIKNLAQEKYSFQLTGIMPSRYKEIDEIFKD